MRILLVKTSSMGDLIHTFPALTDAGKAIPGISFDWMVEENFSVIPTWHPLVNDVIPIAMRRWRKTLLSSETRHSLQALRKELSGRHYDLILDAQGLVKSAVLTFLARGLRVGLDWRSARESLASLAYQRKCTVNFYQHAVVRMRSLFSQALQYPLPATAPDFGLVRSPLQQTNQPPYVVFLFGTTWQSKQWPESYWITLATLIASAGFRIKVSGGNDEEMARAERIANACEAVDVLPCLTINDMASLLASARGVVAVDTGFGHLAGALNIPTVSLYGATNPAYTGALGDSSIQLAAEFACSPCLNRTCHYKQPAEVTPACYTTLPPIKVWAALQPLIQR